MTPPRRICLVSPSHVASNPRLVKEADALHSAGYDVHVISGWYFPPLDRYDLEIFKNAPWKRTVVYYMTGPRVLWAKFRRKAARHRLALAGIPTLPIAVRAHHAASSLLTRAAKRVKAELYIGHCLAGLPAAAGAAQHHGALYGFDAEDFHSAESENALNDPVDAACVQTIESSLLPGCAHLTAASPLIGKAYAERYGIRLPTTVLNAFPLAHAPALKPAPHSVDAPVRLYWFSQTVGPGRGLEALVDVLGKMGARCELHLRGLPSPDFLESLRRRARGAGYLGKIEFLQIGSAAEMARLATGYDLGLSLEQTTPRNRDLCLTNKIFTYLLAGVPVGLTPTSAQTALSPELGDAAVPLDLSAPEKAAAALTVFFQDTQRRATARDTAWHLGQTRFNWEIEQIHLLSAVASVFGKHAHLGSLS